MDDEKRRVFIDLMEKSPAAKISGSIRHEIERLTRDLPLLREIERQRAAFQGL
jgi:hypothetical protein